MKVADAKISGPLAAAPVKRGRRRTYSRQFKREVVAQCLVPGASVSAIALSHGINANVIRKWLPKHAPRAAAGTATMLPVTIGQAAVVGRPGRQFDLARTYGADDLLALRDVLKRDYGAKNADELLSIPTDFRGGRAPGAHIFQAVEMLSGGNAKDALKAAGFDALNAGQELIVLNSAGTVRDKALARFDPNHRLSADPLAALGLGSVGLGLLGQRFDDE